MGSVPGCLPALAKRWQVVEDKVKAGREERSHATKTPGAEPIGGGRWEVPPQVAGR